MARPDGNPHDAIVKFVFKDPAHAGPLLESLLPERLSRAIDWATLERRDVTLVEPALRETRSDLVFTVELQGRRAWLYVLFEHQSEYDPWMPLRLLGYMTRLWEDQRKERGSPLSPVLPVVLYHGEPSWPRGARFTELFELSEESLALVREHCPDFRIIVDDLGTRDDAELRSRALSELALVALLLLRDGRKVVDLEASFGPWLQTFRAVANAPTGADAMVAVFSYLSRVAQSDQQRLETFARRIGPTAESATMTAAEEIARQAREQGREEGREQGRREVLVKLITLRFGAPDAATLQTLERATAEQLSRCAERVLGAATLEEVLEPCR